MLPTILHEPRPQPSGTGKPPSSDQTGTRPTADPNLLKQHRTLGLGQRGENTSQLQAFLSSTELRIPLERGLGRTGIVLAFPRRDSGNARLAAVTTSAKDRSREAGYSSPSQCTRLQPVLCRCRYAAIVSDFVSVSSALAFSQSSTSLPSVPFLLRCSYSS